MAERVVEGLFELEGEAEALERWNRVGRQVSALTGENRAGVVSALRLSSELGNVALWEWLRDLLVEALPPAARGRGTDARGDGPHAGAGEDDGLHRHG